jgi:hypothetical protein
MPADDSKRSPKQIREQTIKVLVRSNARIAASTQVMVRDDAALLRSHDAIITSRAALERLKGRRSGS